MLRRWTLSGFCLWSFCILPRSFEGPARLWYGSCFAGCEQEPTPFSVPTHFDLLSDAVLVIAALVLAFAAVEALARSKWKNLGAMFAGLLLFLGLSAISKSIGVGVV